MDNKTNNNIIKTVVGLFVVVLCLTLMERKVYADPTPVCVLYDSSGKIERDRYEDINSALNHAENGDIIRMIDDYGVNNLCVPINMDSTNSNSVTIDLNGKLIRMNATGLVSSVITIKEGRTLTLTDSSGGTGKIDANNKDVCIVIIGENDGNKGTFIMKGGVLCNGANEGHNVSGAYGGAVCNHGTFVLEGGTIESCTAKSGGGVYIYANADFTMTGGSINGCTANGNNTNEGIGGGVCNFGTFTMTGGAIRGCTAGFDGGGVYNAEGKTFTMNGGEIANCSANNCGGGVYLLPGSDFAFKGGATVADNTCNADITKANIFSAISDTGEISKVTLTGDFSGKMEFNKSSNGTDIMIKLANNRIYEGLNNIIFNNVANAIAKAYIKILPDGTVVAVPNNGNDSYTVTFNLNGHGTNRTVKYEKNSRVICPENLKALGYGFGGWYKDSAFTKKWLFYGEAGADEITANTTLYAKWMENKNEENSVMAEESTETSDDSLDELRAKLATAISLGGDRTVTWDKGTALPYDIMKTLQDNPRITLVFSYTYENVDFKVTLPGKYVKAYTTIPWYGPLYLYAYYGGRGAVQNVSNINASNRTYTVVKGDTLTGIAIKLNTKVKRLVSLNNIKDPDKLKIGQVLKY